MQQKSNKVVLFVSSAIFLILLVSVISLWTLERRRASRSLPSTTNVLQQPIRAASPVESNQPPTTLQTLYTYLTNATDAASARRQFADLRRALLAGPTNATVSAIRQLLDSKTDAPTHLGFKVGAGGLLDEAPTLRTFLLDQLARLDPAAAAEYSKIILASMDSPDEWAVALRNVARGDTSPEARALLEQKTGDLLRHEPWQQDPSVGYLEAFDVAVYLDSTNLLPALGELVRKQDNPAVAHASFLAIDRLVINDPDTMLAALGADPALMQGRELTRANYFARADVRDAQQRQILENYLLSPQISATELSQFAGLYPSANYMISANLLTPTPTPDHSSLVARDAESMRVLQEWLADPRFANILPQLQKAKMRLEDFIRQGTK